jgi:hypothetical protein
MPLGGRGDDDYDNNVRWEEQDMPSDLCRDRRRAEGGEGGVNDGVDDEHVNRHVWGPRLVDFGNGRWWRLRRDGDNDMTSRRADRIPPPRRRRQRASWRRGCIPLATTGSRQRRQRATLTMAATTNMLTGMSGVCIRRMSGMGDGEDRSATVTMMTASKRADRIPPH